MIEAISVLIPQSEKDIEVQFSGVPAMASNVGMYLILLGLLLML